MRICPSCRSPIGWLWDLARDPRLRSGWLGIGLLIARLFDRILLYRSWSTIYYIEIAHFNRPVKRCITSILILLLQVLVLDECLLRSVFLLTFICDLFVFLRDLALLQLVHFLLELFSSLSCICTLCIQFSLQDLAMGQLMRVVYNIIVPARP